MPSHNKTPSWEAPELSISSPQQSEDWKVFYTRAIDFLEILNINVKEAYPTKTGRKQLKMMFEGKDRQTFHTLINSGTITEEADVCSVSATGELNVRSENQGGLYASQAARSHLRFPATASACAD